MARLTGFDTSTLDAAGAPAKVAYLSASIGSFALDGQDGSAIFVWYHEDGGLDVHRHALTFKGTGKLGTADIYAYAPAGSDEGEHAHELFLFTKEPQSPHEGHRVFYLAHGHLHLWAADMRCLPLHEAA